MIRRTQGEGSVFFNDTRRKWQVAISLGYDENGKRKKKILSADTEALAWQAYNQFMGNGVTLKPQTPQEYVTSQITLKECYDRYLWSIENDGSERAFGNKVLLAKSIQAEVGHYSLSELTEDILRRYLNSWTTKTYIKGENAHLYSQNHISKVYTNLKCVIKYAVKNKLLLTNLMEDISEPVAKKFEEEKCKTLSTEEMSMIIDALSNKPLFQTMVTIMAYTGIRPGEAYALKFSDFDFKNQTISVKRALSNSSKSDVGQKVTRNAKPLVKLLKNERGKKKEYARRVLKVSDKVLDAVKRWEELLKSDEVLTAKRVRNGTSEFLFTKPSTGELGLPDYYSVEYKKELKRNGLDGGYYNLYRFRHTFCTRLFKVHKLDPKTVQLMMRDNSMDMVMHVYNSVNKGDILEASEMFARTMDLALEA